MIGALLKSGKLTDYTALGVDGQPIYKVADQLRETVRLKCGGLSANSLAVPQPDQRGTKIDWYAPFPGEVVPWARALPQDRARILESLDSMYRQLTNSSRTMEGVTAREKIIAQNLLAKALFIPDASCVFLIDGRPVLTFWGFLSPNSADSDDPFAALRSAIDDPPPRIPTSLPEVQTTTKLRSWWLLLGALCFLLAASALYYYLTVIRSGSGAALVVSGVAPDNKSVGAALVFPSSAVDNKSVFFFTGNWRADTNVVETRTNDPVVIDYLVLEGLGRVVVTRSDGRQCSGDVKSYIEGENLYITYVPNDLPCTDGSIISIRATVCSSGAAGVAECTFEGDEGSFPLRSFK